MRDTTGSDGGLEALDDGLLPDELIKTRRSMFAVEGKAGLGQLFWHARGFLALFGAFPRGRRQDGAALEH